jgi:hypothetical protein
MSVDGSPSTNATLDHRPDQRSRAKKALLLVPHWSANKIYQDIYSATEGLYLRE